MEELKRTSDSAVSLAWTFSSKMFATTSSWRKISIALIMSRTRKTRTLKPLSDNMNLKRSSVADTTARISKDFHSNDLYNIYKQKSHFRTHQKSMQMTKIIQQFETLTFLKSKLRERLLAIYWISLPLRNNTWITDHTQEIILYGANTKLQKETTRRMNNGDQKKT